MSLDPSQAIHVEHYDYLQPGNGRTYRGTRYFFNCSGCGAEICATAEYAKVHSGKCRRCVQKLEPFRNNFHSMKRGASRLGKVFTLTFENFLEFTEISECFYCGAPVPWVPYRSNRYNLDRKVNDIGYTRENCVVCCWSCNRLKSAEFTFEEMLLLAPALRAIRAKRSTLLVR